MKISSLPEGDICDVSFGYNHKMYEYTTLMSDIPKLAEIFLFFFGLSPNCFKKFLNFFFIN